MSIGVHKLDMNVAQDGQASLDQSLNKYAHANVIQYGASSLSSVTLRGSSSSQVATYWNGMVLNNPNNGGVDYSLIPNFLLGKVEVISGGPAINFGSGAIGAISLSSNIDSNKWGSLLSYNSMNNIQVGIEKNIHRRKSSYGLRVFNSDDKNNFPFLNDQIVPHEKRKMYHANKILSGITFSHKTNLKPNTHVSTHLWTQIAKRQLPITKLLDSSKESQTDAFVRASMHYERFAKNRVHILDAGANGEYLQYIPITAFDTTNYRSLLSFLRYKIGYQIFRFHLATSIESHWSFADNKFYSSNRPLISRYTMLQTFNARYRRYLFHVGIRQEYINQKLAPSQPYFTTEWNRHHWTLALNIHRVYRIPTLNDLYWPNAGNPLLKPEDASCKELQIKFHKKGIGISTAIYHRNVKNWIQWTPKQGNLWTPENIGLVQSRGVELFLNGTKNKFQWNGNTLFNQSTILKSYSSSQVGKQLLYNPNIISNLNLEYRLKFLHPQLHLKYTSKRFMTTDNTDYVPAFMIVNMNCSIPLFSGKSTFQFFVNNLLNKNYEIIANRAMPLRTAGIALSYKY
jgi:iron complex outermembrane receptor protein